MVAIFFGIALPQPVKKVVFIRAQRKHLRVFGTFVETLGVIVEDFGNYDELEEEDQGEEGADEVLYVGVEVGDYQEEGPVIEVPVEHLHPRRYSEALAKGLRVVEQITKLKLGDVKPSFLFCQNPP